MNERTQGRKSLAAVLTGVALVSGAVALGCVGKIGPLDPIGEDRSLGQITLALVLPGGATVTEVLWELHSGTDTTLAAGTIHTDNPSAKLRLAVGAPVGNGDTFRMSATTSRGERCAGISPPFDVVSGRTVDVEVTLLCSNVSGPDGGVGTVAVRGTLVPGDSCPVLTSWALSPQETAAAGGQIDLTVAASDADGEALTYAWTATAGSFSDPATASTRYLCGPAGTQTLTVTISDAHQPTACFVTVTFPEVSCVASSPVDGGPG